jgi:5'-deoxynucleotidase
METPFYYLLYRSRLTPRWSGTFCLDPEDVAQHSHSVAIITHILCEIKKTIYNENIDTGTAVLCAIYHDSIDTVLTHIIAPIKKHQIMSESYDEICKTTESHIQNMLPVEFHAGFENLLRRTDEYSEYWDVVSVANKIDRLCKCMFEVSKGNQDFKLILEESERSMDFLVEQYSYANYFMRTFFPNFYTCDSAKSRYLSK